MRKVGFLFSGQGSQYQGMGKDLYNNFEASRKVYDKASSLIGLDIKDLSFNGKKEEINITKNTQPLIVTMSLAALAALRESKLEPYMVAGLSLGEYSALTASGAFDLEDVIPLVRKRGQYMQEAVPQGLGIMAVILKLSKEDVRQICIKASQYGLVEEANYNGPGQIVIGGEVSAVEKAIEIARTMGARTMILPVSAPFHTSMLKGAADKLKVELDKIKINKMNTKVISNVNALVIEDESEIKDLLYNQVMKPVLWEQSMKLMLEEGIRDFIEIGPGKVLSNLMKSISKDVNIYNIEDVKTLEETLSKLG